MHTLPIKLSSISDELRDYLVWQCEKANSLYNSILFVVRKQYFSEAKRSAYFKGDDYRCGLYAQKCRKYDYRQIQSDFKENENFRAIGANAAKNLCKEVDSSIKSYNSLVSLFYQNGGYQKQSNGAPKLPSYRKSGGLHSLTYDAVNLSIKDGCIKLPNCKSIKQFIDFDLTIDVPEFVLPEKIKQIRIRPSRGELWCDFIIEDGKEEITNNLNLDYSHALSIDHGVKFWLSAVTTKKRSFIVEAPQLKTAIWKYQQKVKQYKQNKSNFYWDEYLDKLTAKYNLQIRDAVNKAARFIVNHCLNNGIGNLVIGWNKGNKQNINLGRKNNYEIVNMPTARLIKRLEELSKEYGIKFIVTTEEYTSKASFVDNDELHQYGAKPAEWKPSGKRISRDEYRTKNGNVIHADLNAAGNILRKVFDQVFPHRFQGKIRLEAIKRGALTRPKRYDVFKNLKKKYRKKTLRSAAD
ncbi:MAG: transposase [Cyanobacteria bacterium P01_C01_bin.38]